MLTLCPLCKLPIEDNKYVKEIVDNITYLVHEKCIEKVENILDEEDDLEYFGKNIFLFADDNIELSEE
jgi:ribosome assembly protein YihI (activator of Der GTPase)